MNGRVTRTVVSGCALTLSCFLLDSAPPTACDKQRKAKTDLQIEKYSLVQVQTVFRHGARTPVRNVPSTTPQVAWEPRDVIKDDIPSLKVRVCTQGEKGQHLPLSDLEFSTSNYTLHTPGQLLGGALPGELTVIGMLQAADYDKSKVLVRSTCTNRTIETAQGVLTGMFPDEVLSDDVVDVIILPDDQQKKEWAVANFGTWCPRLRTLFKTAILLANENIPRSTKELLKELDSLLHFDVNDKDSLGKLHILRDHLHCREANRKALPDKHDQIDGLTQKMGDAGTQHMMEIFSGGCAENRDEALRLCIGRLFAVITDTMQRCVVPSSPDRYRLHHRGLKMILYSGHDWSVMPMLMCLNLPDIKWPKFCSSLSFELWEKQGAATKGNSKYCIRVLYNDEALDLNHILPATNSNKYLYDLDDFIKYIKLYSMELDGDEMKRLCHLH